MRTTAVLAVIGVRRLARVLRCRWRLSLGLSGAALEVFGLALFTGGARGPAEFAGLVAVLVALLKSKQPAGERHMHLPQLAWRPPN